MSDGASSASGTESKADEKSASALGGAADTSKNGATGNETPTGTNAAAKGADGKGAGTEGAGGEKQPEAFDFTKWEPKAVEGKSRDAKALDETRTLFGKLKLSGEQAQALVEFADAREQASEAARLQAREDARAAGLKDLQADPDIGGAKWETSQKQIARAIREFGGKALYTRLMDLGVDNDPVIVRALLNAGRRLGEDSVGDTAHKAGAEKADTFEARVSRTYSKTKET